MTMLDTMMYGVPVTQTTTSSKTANDTDMKQSEVVPAAVSSTTAAGQMWGVLSTMVLFYIVIYGLTLIERGLGR